MPATGKPPLSGRTICVTRARTQAAELSTELAALGASVLEAPAIELADPPDWAPCDRALERLATYDWIVFTSQNTLPRLVAHMRSRGVPESALSGPRVAAIGEATARALESAGLAVHAMPDEYRAEAVVERLAREGLAGRRVLLPRALVAREVLPERLREAGATVDVVPVYAALPVAEGAREAREALLHGRLDAVTFTSSSTVDNFLLALGAAGDGPEALRAKDALRRTCLASIGPITSSTLARHGLAARVEAAPYTIPGLVRALRDHFTGAPEESNR